MPKKIAVALVVSLALIRCSGTDPAAPSLVNETAGNPAMVHTTSNSPSSVLGASHSLDGFPTWQVGGATGDFRFSPDPPQGTAPLTAHINMCHSTDPSPGFNLHYHVTWGDASDDQGFCRFEHVYTTEGQFQAVACVWDEIPAHAPGSCLPIAFTVNAKATRTPAPPSFTPPTVGVTHTAGVVSGSPWIVCRADTSTAWITSTTLGGGIYNAIPACQSIGYTSVTAHGGTCGMVCGFCGRPIEFYDGQDGCVFPQMCSTVTWRCAR